MEREDLQVRLEIALRRLLELGGVDMEKLSQEQWDYLDPMETMLYAPPSFWLDSAAQHLYEIAGNCQSIVDDFGSLLKAASSGTELPEDSLLVLWATIDDLEFHLFTSHLHTYLIRYALLFQASRVQADVLKPTAPELPAPDLQWSPDPLTRAVVLGLGIPADEARGIVDDVVALTRHCKLAGMAVERLGSEPEAGLDVIGRRFSDVQLACASLAGELVRTDVSVDKLSQLSIVDP